MNKFKIASIDLFCKDSFFFKLTKDGVRVTHTIIAIPIILLFLIAGTALGEIIFKLILNNPSISNAFKSLYKLIAYFSGTILFMWLWIRFFEKRSLYSIGLTKANGLKNYIQGFITGIIMILTVIGLMALSGFVHIESEEIPEGSNAIGMIFLFLIGYIIQGGSEEMLIRGWLFQVIGSKHKPWIGAVISSIIFALLHFTNSHITILSLINLFLFAIFLTFLVLKDNNIWAACGWHSAWNWTTENILGLNLSGCNSDSTLINLSTSGHEYLSGGKFGPEGSIFTGLVLIAGMVVILIIRRKKVKEKCW